MMITVNPTSHSVKAAFSNEMEDYTDHRLCHCSFASRYNHFPGYAKRFRAKKAKNLRPGVMRVYWNGPGATSARVPHQHFAAVECKRDPASTETNIA